MRNNIPIFLSADNVFAPFVATTIASICDHTRSFCDFYVLDGGITPENKQKICALQEQFKNFSIEFIQIDYDQYFKDYDVNKSYSSKSMYSRFLIPELKNDLDKVIYSDVDVIFMGDIAEYYSINIDPYILGCVAAPFINMKKIEALFGLSPQHVYFCSGNLIINCQKWRKQKIFDQLTQINNQFKDKLVSPDQDILNICFGNNYKILPEKYCVTEYHLDWYGQINDIFIRHYGTDVKPWMLNPVHGDDVYPNLSDFWRYAKMTKFYDDLIMTTCDEEKQNNLLAKLRVNKLIRKRNAINA